MFVYILMKKITVCHIKLFKIYFLHKIGKINLSICTNDFALVYSFINRYTVDSGGV